MEQALSTRPEDRPDPLAPLPERPKPGQPPPGPAYDLSLCSALPNGRDHCQTPPSLILWIGCTRGEHVGPLAYCAAHFLAIGRHPRLICSQCGGEVRMLMATSMDGKSYQAWLDGEPPAHLWREIFPDA